MGMRTVLLLLCRWLYLAQDNQRMSALCGRFSMRSVTSSTRLLLQRKHCCCACTTAVSAWHHIICGNAACLRLSQPLTSLAAPLPHHLQGRPGGAQGAVPGLAGLGGRLGGLSGLGAGVLGRVTSIWGAGLECGAVLHVDACQPRQASSFVVSQSHRHTLHQRHVQQC